MANSLLMGCKADQRVILIALKVYSSSHVLTLIKKLFFYLDIK
jgi:hypothetical protein